MKRLVVIFCGILAFTCHNAFADVTCESDETLVNGECVLVCDSTTINFEYDGVCIKNKFQVTTTSDTNRFAFHMAAAGTFYINWGDGTIEKFTPTNNSPTEYSHNYATTDSYTIGFGGVATAYYINTYAANYNAITFGNVESNTTHTYDKIAGISGSLGKLFPILSATQRPRFAYTFNGCTNLSGSIPASLFSGLSGPPQSAMFFQTFKNCSNLTGPIPSNLFTGISGAPTSQMFRETFSGCSNLTGPIPGNLFSGISGESAPYMFAGTFNDCSKLGTENDIPTYGIPSTLFSGISGTPKTQMYNGTFSGCSGLTGPIPAGLFGNISGAPAASMFFATFKNCSNLTGSIPSGLFGNIYGTPAARMFLETFQNCSKLIGSIPIGLFGTFDGAPQTEMFSMTFYGCSGLNGYIPSNIFAGISGTMPYRSLLYTFNGTNLVGFQYPDGTTTTYIPPTFFANISTESGINNAASIFNGTKIVKSCPENTYQYITGFEVDFNGKVSCTPCPTGLVSPAGSTNVSQCTQPTVNIIWDDGMGNITENTCIVNGVVTLPPTPVRPGYTFGGWAVVQP